MKAKLYLGLAHLFFWVVVVWTPYVSANAKNTEVLIPFLINQAFVIAAFYLNALLMIPKLLLKKKTGVYAVALFGLLIILSISTWYGHVENLIENPENFPLTLHRERNFPKPNLAVKMGLSFFPSLFFMGLSISYSLLFNYFRNQRLLAAKEKENLKMELTFLRSQVSPHFLFNVLNSMVAMARINSEKLEPSLIQLSALLRYMLYSAEQQSIPLIQELEYINSYISLQSVRYGTRLTIHKQIEINDDKFILPPMLLIPFIENAFKHGIGAIENPFIEIRINTRVGKLIYVVINKISPDSAPQKDGISGIGLLNLQARLMLLFPNHHKIKTVNENGIYHAELELWQNQFS